MPDRFADDWTPADADDSTEQAALLAEEEAAHDEQEAAWGRRNYPECYR